jgi:hypothetical protein
MYKKAQSDSVGVVGTLLLYGDGATIQHAGVYLEPGGMASHIYIKESYSVVKHNPVGMNYPYPLEAARQVTAVTAAFSLVARTKLDEVGGYD